MHFLIPALILGMLGFWVYSLKQEIHDLQGRISHSSRESRAADTHTSIADVKIAQKGEVQTWVLE